MQCKAAGSQEQTVALRQAVAGAVAGLVQWTPELKAQLPKGHGMAPELTGSLGSAKTWRVWLQDVTGLIDVHVYRTSAKGARPLGQDSSRRGEN